MQANGFGGASPPTSLRAKEPHGSGALAFFNPASNQSLADQFKSCGLLARADYLVFSKSLPILLVFGAA